MTEKFIYTRVNLKPLMPVDFDIDAKKVLESTRRDLHRRIKQELEQELFSPRAKRAMARALTIKIKPKSLQIIANHPAFAPLVNGQTTEQMTWLTKATRPIPIITPQGNMIFRSATAKSMTDGKWQHPGRKPSTFVDRAKKVSREHIKERLRKHAVKSVKQAIGKASR